MSSHLLGPELQVVQWYSPEKGVRHVVLLFGTLVASRHLRPPLLLQLLTPQPETGHLPKGEQQNAPSCASSLDRRLRIRQLPHHGAGAPPDLHNASGFEFSVRPRHGGGVHAKFCSELTHRRKSRPRRMPASGHSQTQAVGDLCMQWNWALGVDSQCHTTLAMRFSTCLGHTVTPASTAQTPAAHRRTNSSGQLPNAQVLAVDPSQHRSRAAPLRARLLHR